MVYAVTFIFVFGCGFMTWKVVKLWRDPALVDFFIGAFTFLPFGPSVRRGEVRSLGVTVVSVWAIAGLITLALWDMGQDPNKEQDPVTTVLGLIAVLVILGCLVVEACVILFNCPKFVVPPHMRSEPGVLAARRAKRARRAGGRRTT